MPQDAIEAKLDALNSSVRDGFEGQDRRLSAIEHDLKDLREEGLPRRTKKLEERCDEISGQGLPRRTKKLEEWKDRISSRWWAIASGSMVAVFGAWMTVLFQQS